MARLLAVAFLLLPAAARALPPDRVVFLETGGDTFEKGPAGSWVATSTDAGVVEAEYFPAAEVHLLAKGEGTALVVLTNRVIGQAKFWEVRVGKQKPDRPDPAVLKDACGCSSYPLECQVKNSKCLEALRRFVKGTDLTTNDLRLTYNVEGLQALLKDLQSRLEQGGFKDTQLAFLGANLRIQGEVEDEEAWRRLLVSIYHGMLGRLVIENKVRIKKKGDGK
jgi:hypothetical protein